MISTKHLFFKAKTNSREVGSKKKPAGAWGENVHLVGGHCQLSPPACEILRATSPFLWEEKQQSQTSGSQVTSWLHSEGVGQGDWRYKKEPNLGSMGREGACWHKSSCLSQLDVQLSGIKLLFCFGPSAASGPTFLLGARICNPMKVAGPGRLSVFLAGSSPEQFYFHQNCSLALPHV